MSATLLQLLDNVEIERIKNKTSVDVNNYIRDLTMDELLCISVKEENIHSTISELIKRSKIKKIEIF